MIALEGQKFMNFDKSFEDKQPEFDNVVYLELKKELTACKISQELSNYGDVYVVKDSRLGCFAEFNFIDEKVTGPNTCLRDLV